MGSEARARLGLAALLGVTLFVYLQVFAQGDYPGPILLGMLVAGGLAVGARRMGAGTLLTLALSLVMLFWYLSLIFAAGRTYYGVPTPGAAEGLGSAVATAYGHSQVDFAPVTVRPGYVIVLVAALWVATTVGELATFRWRRPLMASILPLTLFCIALVVGSGKAAPVFITLFLAALLSYWGLESSHRVRSWGRWIGTWAGRRDDEAVSVVGRMARGMGATCVVAALVSPLVLPGFGEGLLPWRRGGGGGPGTGFGTRLDPLVSIAPRLLRQTDRELFRVRSERSKYWRVATLVNFDGETWSAARSPYEEVTTVPFGSGVPPGGFTQTLQQQFQITGLEGESLPAAPSPRQLVVTNPEERQDDVLVDPTTQDLSLDGGVEEGFGYSVFSDAPDVSYGDMRGAELGVSQASPGGDLDPQYFALPPGAITPEVDDLTDRWTARASTPFEALVALQSHFQRFTYSTDPSVISLTEQTASTDLLTTFLTRTKAGYCQQFATAFALLGRHLGYPTRVVVGFLPGEQSRIAANEWIVRGTDAHAWPEVYFKDYGWMAFEPTPRSDRLPLVPVYTIQGGVSGEDPRTIGLDPGASQNDPLDARIQGQERRSGGVEAFGATDPPGRSRPAEAAWERHFARVAWMAAALLVVFLIAVPALKRWRIWRRYARADTSAEKVAAAFAEFEQVAGELAVVRSPAETATAYALRVAALRTLADAPTRRLATIHDAARYGRRETPDAAATEAHALTRELTSKLWSRASWWERGTRLFSPRGLGLAGRP